jgi:hypothetical protein
LSPLVVLGREQEPLAGRLEAQEPLVEQVLPGQPHLALALALALLVEQVLVLVLVLVLEAQEPLVAASRMLAARLVNRPLLVVPLMAQQELQVRGQVDQNSLNLVRV